MPGASSLFALTQARGRKEEGGIIGGIEVRGGPSCFMVCIYIYLLHQLQTPLFNNDDNDDKKKSLSRSRRNFFLAVLRWIHSNTTQAEKGGAAGCQSTRFTKRRRKCRRS